MRELSVRNGERRQSDNRQCRKSLAVTLRCRRESYRDLSFAARSGCGDQMEEAAGGTA